MTNQFATSPEKHVVSVVVATKNSGRYLSDVIRSIQMQSLGSMIAEIEVLVVDGMSDDRTRDIAQDFGAHVVENPQIDAINGKYLGFCRARGSYVMFLDHDEILVSSMSLVSRVEILAKNPGCVAALTSGYLIPRDMSAANAYASEFGDPVSLFMYRQSSLSKRRVRALCRKFYLCEDAEDFIVLGPVKKKQLYLLEPVALGTIIKKSAVEEVVSRATNPPAALVDASFILNSEIGCNQVVVMKKDAVIHRSADSWKTVRTKIKWRVNNYIIDPFSLAESGLRGRISRQDRLINLHARMRFVGYVFYVLLVAPLAIDAAYLALRERRIGYLMHFPLAFYTLWCAVAATAHRLMGGLRSPLNYDGSPGRG